jgi:hypothetical protein
MGCEVLFALLYSMMDIAATCNSLSWTLSCNNVHVVVSFPRLLSSHRDGYYRKDLVVPRVFFRMDNYKAITTDDQQFNSVVLRTGLVL